MLNCGKRNHYLVHNIELDYPNYVTAVPIFIDQNKCRIVVRIFDDTITAVLIKLKDKVTGTENSFISFEGSNEITTEFILEKKEYITTPIPKKIYQTLATYNISKDCLKTIDTIKDFNPDYEYFFFDDNEIYDFMLLNYGKNSKELNALNWLEPGAYRADLFRYCILHLQGGIYADCKQMWKTNFDSILTTGRDYYYVKDFNKTGVYNALMMTIPNTDIFKKCIKQIIFNVTYKIYINNDTLAITGPTLLGKYVKLMLKNFTYEMAHNVVDNNHCDYYAHTIINTKTNKILALKSYPTYTNDRSGKRYSTHYAERSVYKYKIRSTNYSQL